MGAYPYLASRFDLVDLQVIARRRSSSPATGFHKQHVREQERIINRVFHPEKQEDREKNEQPTKEQVS